MKITSDFIVGIAVTVLAFSWGILLWNKFADPYMPWIFGGMLPFLLIFGVFLTKD